MADLHALVADVAGLYDVTADQVLGGRGNTTVVEARQAAMYTLRERGLPYARIGQLLGRHHTSVIHGVRVHAARHGLPVPGVQSGPKPHGVDAGRVVAHLRRLREAGMTRAAIAAAAGMNATHVSRILCGRQRHVLPDTAARLLAVTPPAVTCEDCAGPSLGGGRWCGIGRCVTGRRWSWSQQAVSA